jgi:putative oxidoreductase
MSRPFRRYWPIPLRIILGIAFMVHGAPKLFSAEAHRQFEGMLGQLGVPAPQLMSWVVGLVEFGGGLAIALGLFTWLAAGLLAVDMIVAALLVHAPQGFANVQITGMSDRGPIFGMPGYELNLVYLAGLLALLVGGPGPLSVDERTRRPRSPLLAPWWRHREAQA